jgi:hypothetical protein
MEIEEEESKNKILIPIIKNPYIEESDEEDEDDDLLQV